MRAILASIVAAACATGAFAADKPALGPAPAWVKPVPLPTTEIKDDGSAVHLILQDQQVHFERGRTVAYARTVMKIGTPQGFAAGNIAFAWNPETSTPTVHRLVIHRGTQDIDVLAHQSFTVVRRETNLENAMLDGVLTATLQPEGLQVGDVVEFAISIDSSDPVLAGHVEQIGGSWNGLQIGHASLRAEWPAALQMHVKQARGLPPVEPFRESSERGVKVAVDNLEPLLPINGAPARYQLVRTVEMTDFGSWADVAALLAPLYTKAAVIPASGPLREQLTRIASVSPDPKKRAQAALSLVQDQIRYVFLGMNSGSLVPADASTTWERRFGDCKGKTALLLALLHGLGVDAVPVVVNATSGDGMDQHLPMVGLFNHVLVRAMIGGRTYWLDGTRTGDTDIDRIRTPNFGWGLPLVPERATLVRLLPPPLEQPASDSTIELDASGGITLPGPIRVQTILRGDGAVVLRDLIAQATPEMQDKMMREYWRRKFNFVDVTKASTSFDPEKREELLTMEGVAHMEWHGEWYWTDWTRLGWDADFHRETGPDQDAPFALVYPDYTKSRETIKLPPSFDIGRWTPPADIDQTTAGLHFVRHTAIKDNAVSIETSTQTMQPEFPAADAPAAQTALRKLYQNTVSLRRPHNYSYSDAEIAAALQQKADSASDYVDRAFMLSGRRRYKEAIAELDKAVAMDGKNVDALANRGLCYVQIGDLAQGARDLDAAYAIDPRNAVMLRGRGMLAVRQGRHADAIAAFGASLEVDPNNSFALGWRALERRASGDEDGAMADADASLKINPSWDQLIVMRIDIAQAHGQSDKAETLLSEGLAANSKSAFLLLAAANFHASTGKWDQAKKDYDAALALKPTASVYLNRAHFRPKDDIAGRKADLDAILKLNPTGRTELIQISQIQHEIGDEAGAVRSLDKVIAANPKSSDLLVRRGVAESRAGSADKAEKDFAAARALDTSPEAANEMCWTKVTSGVALQSALEDCNAALAKKPDEAAYLDSRGLVQMRLGNYDAAIADYDKALAKNPKQAASLYGRGVAYARKGDKARSDADIQAAQKISTWTKVEFDSYGLHP